MLITVTCTLNGDPHIKGFDNKLKFDEYAVGDFILAEWSNLVVGKWQAFFTHEEFWNATKLFFFHLECWFDQTNKTIFSKKQGGRFNTVPQWGKQSTTRAIAVRYNGNKVTVHADTKEVKVNDKVVKINIKSTSTFASGLEIHREKDNQYVITAGTERVAVTLNAVNKMKDSEWLDVIIFTSTDKSKTIKRGLCKDKFKVEFTGFTSKRKHFVPNENPKRYSEKEAAQFCAKLKKTSEMQYHFCVADYIVGGPSLAQHIFKTDERKNKWRKRYGKSKKCRRAEDALAKAKSAAEKSALQKLAAIACKPKKRSASCKRAQKFYAAAAQKFAKTKASRDVPQVVKDELQKLLTAFGAKVNAICDAKKQRKQCKLNRKNTLAFLNKQLAELEERAKKVKSQIAAQKAIKCKKPVPTLKKICLMV